ncbi:AfsR/SARP family transcriptional regulator [Streptomyces sp. UNOC14_S4]|uniref:AfsR/SARP family transcriptional regulator n=1 Tax=Streptomyces sp. UNOC14_S4 TaxID=2872340 RepID=UPI001E3D8D01|nr:AfsR/SARP family transcriptional regulator [Streptomyces sp. UNOC14_S4]MCC3766399.1 winged helix-turn-helix domain-containing protein [Streptomyces sp. UNOC14_S4]
MEFSLLGPVTAATVAAGELPLGPAKRRSVLAMLLLQANTTVSVAQLIDSVWEDEPPAHARTVVQGHVSRLRATLAEAGADAYGVSLATHGSAYLLRLPEALVDTYRFGELVARARPVEAPAEAVGLLREALGLWHGPALTGTVPTPPFAAAAHALEERRLHAVESLARAYGALGAHDHAVAALLPEAAAQPLRESLVATLMLALHRAGRRSEAMEWYHRTRRLLADDLGVDPGEALRAAYGTLLAPTVGAAPPVSPESPERTTRTDPWATPQLLPRRPAGFLGRDGELDGLTRLLTGSAEVALVTGPAGVGKTAFAAHWAHVHGEAFPDGRLFADLRGFSGGEEAQPCEVLREFLLALGTPADRIPSSQQAASALYRSIVAGRRLLVVLDNARSSAQVRPLLPAGAECATIVTSRSRLDGLVATDSARPLRLRALGTEEGVALLGAVLGPDRVAEDPEAAAELVALCEGLPLALRAAAAQLTARPRWRLARLASALRDERQRLALLSAEDTGVAAALRASVARLSEDDARLLSALGTGFSRVVDVSAVAALAGADPDVTRYGLDRLAEMHLVDEESTGRYVMTDLVKLFAQRRPE